jgi:L-threonylcarbamoyladenylate synthase
MGLLIKIPENSQELIRFFSEYAADFIIEGKIIAFPTDTVYGIGGDPLNVEVIHKINEIKFREESKGLLLLVADIEEASKVAEFNTHSRILAEKYWPGQLTLILNKKKGSIIPPELTGYKDSIGVRVANNDILTCILGILRERGQFGGIIGTSANYSGESPSVSGDEVAKKIMSPIDLIIDGGKAKSKIASTIIDCTSAQPKIIREGYIKEDEILNLLNIAIDFEEGDESEQF